MEQPGKKPRWKLRIFLGIVFILVVLSAISVGRIFYVTYTQVSSGEAVDLSQFGGEASVQTDASSNVFDAGEIETIVNKTLKDPIIGPNDAKLTIVSFQDFECPYCGRVFPTYKRIQAQYKDQVKFVFRDLPLSSIHPNAQKAAEAAQCAHEQGKFDQYHDRLFLNQNRLSVTDLKNHAAAINLDTQRFDNCLDSGEYEEEVLSDAADALAAGASGTPTFFFNGNRVDGVITEEGFKQIIDFFLEQ